MEVILLGRFIMTEIKKVVILGAGGHGRVIADSLIAMIENGAPFEFSGFTDEEIHKDTHIDDGVVLGRDADLSRLHKDGIADHFIIGVGSVRGGSALRAKIYKNAQKAGLLPISVIHPKAILSERVEIGHGCAVMAGAVINTGSKLGENCIINTRASLDHDTHIGDHVHIAPGSVLSGNVTVGDCALIGVGAAVLQGIHIGANATIGAGSTVVKSVQADTTVIGMRARTFDN